MSALSWHPGPLALDIAPHALSAQHVAEYKDAGVEAAGGAELFTRVVSVGEADALARSDEFGGVAGWLLVDGAFFAVLLDTIGEECPPFGVGLGAVPPVILPRPDCD